MESGIDPNIGLNLKIDITPAVAALKSFLNIAGDVGAQIDGLMSGKMLRPTLEGIDAEMAKLDATLSQYVSNAGATAAETGAMGGSMEEAAVQAENLGTSAAEGLGQMPNAAMPAAESIASIRKELQEVQEALANAPVGSAQFDQFALKAVEVQQKLDQAQASITRVTGRSVNARMALQQFNWVLSDTPSFAMNFRFGMMAIGNNLDMISNALINLQMEAKMTGTTVMALIKQSITPMTLAMFGLTTAITLAQVIPAFFHKTKDAAKEANDEVKEFESKLKKLSMGSVLGLAQTLDTPIAATRDRIRELKDELVLGGDLLVAGAVDSMILARINQEKKNLKYLTDQRAAAEKDFDERLQGRYGTVQKLQAQIEDYNLCLNAANVTEQKIREIMDAKARTQRELNEILMTTDEWLDKYVAKTELGYKLHYYDLGTVIDRLRIQLAETTEIQKKLEIEQKIHQLIEEEADLELKRQAAIRSAGERRVKVEDDAYKQMRDLQIATIEDEYEKRHSSEEKRHTDAMANLEEEASKAGAIGVDESGKRTLLGDFGVSRVLEQALYQQNVKKMNEDQAYELAKTRAQGIADQTQRENALYEAEKQHILETEKNKELQEAKINALRMDHETKLATIERNELDTAISAAEQLGQILADGFAGANSGAQKMVAALRLALQIAQAMNMLENLKPGESPMSGILGVIGGALGLLGIADEGAVVRGPGLVGVGAGMQEAFIPLDRLPSLAPAINGGAMRYPVMNDGAILQRLDNIERAMLNMPVPVTIIEGTTDINKYRMFKKNFDRIEKGRTG